MARAPKPAPNDPSLAGYLAERRQLIERRLESVLTSSVVPPIMRDPVAAALRSPGKRIRGLLTMVAAEAAGGRKTGAFVTAAAAVEMIHTSSLILDDLPAMDDAELRRGEPALHRQFGEDRAILAAVALLDHAFGLMADAHQAAAPRRHRAGEIIRRVSDAVGLDGSIGGEAVDLHSGGRPLDFETLEFIHSRKTGALFVASAVVGGMLANGSRPTLSALEIYARNLGLAFQITDDVLDVTGTPAELGKDVGKDENRLTFVKLAGVDGARQLAAELIDTSVEAVRPLGSSAKRLVELATMVRDRAS